MATVHFSSDGDSASVTKSAVSVMSSCHTRDNDSPLPDRDEYGLEAEDIAQAVRFIGKALCNAPLAIHALLSSGRGTGCYPVVGGGGEKKNKKREGGGEKEKKKKKKEETI